MMQSKSKQTGKPYADQAAVESYYKLVLNNGLYGFYKVVEATATSITMADITQPSQRHKCFGKTTIIAWSHMKRTIDNGEFPVRAPKKRQVPQQSNFDRFFGGQIRANNATKEVEQLKLENLTLDDFDLFD